MSQKCHITSGLMHRSKYLYHLVGGQSTVIVGERLGKIEPR
jgi:hypothetical protein